jgi:hypothetical protein
MFAKTIIDSDMFLDMPLSTQALYFHLSMRADDDGFINNPRKIQRMIGASDDDLKVLIMKRFILPFDSGVVVIKHWKIHNYIRNDRYKETIYQEEKALLELKENGAYTELETIGIPSGIPTGNQMETQVRLGQDRDRIESGEGSKGKKETTHDLLQRLLSDYVIPYVLQVKLKEWITYKTERKESYKEQGMKSLLKQIENNCVLYGDQAVCDLIDDSMANGWKGIIFDRLKQKAPAGRNYSQPKKSSSFLDLVDDYD